MNFIYIPVLEKYAGIIFMKYNSGELIRGIKGLEFFAVSHYDFHYVCR
jgi:hypothetical protein